MLVMEKGGWQSKDNHLPDLWTTVREWILEFHVLLTMLSFRIEVEVFLIRHPHNACCMLAHSTPSSPPPPPLIVTASSPLQSHQPKFPSCRNWLICQSIPISSACIKSSFMLTSSIFSKVGQYGQGHQRTILFLKRRSCTKPYQSIK